MLNTTLKVSCVGFSLAGLDRAKFIFYRFQFLFTVVIVILPLLKTAF